MKNFLSSRDLALHLCLAQFCCVYRVLGRGSLFPTSHPHTRARAPDARHASKEKKNTCYAMLRSTDIAHSVHCHKHPRNPRTSQRREVFLFLNTKLQMHCNNSLCTVAGYRPTYTTERIATVTITITTLPPRSARPPVLVPTPPQRSGR